MSLWVKVKLALAAVLVLSGIALVLQNMEVVETRFLFMTVAMPRGPLLLVTMLAGVVVGMVVASRFMAAAKPKEKQ